MDSTCTGRREVTAKNDPISKFWPTIVIMLGLPARGKTFYAHRLVHYLNWIGMDAKLFGNDGDPLDSFYDVDSGINNVENFDNNTREILECFVQQGFPLSVAKSLYDAFSWLQIENSYLFCSQSNKLEIIADKDYKPTVAILVELFLSAKDRLNLYEICSKHSLNVLFVECVISDLLMEEANINALIQRSQSKGDLNEVGAFIKQSIFNLQDSYEQMGNTDGNLPFFRITSQQSPESHAHNNFFINRVRGAHLQRIIFFLMSVSPHFVLNTKSELNAKFCNRVILLTRHGESESNLRLCIGGNANLSNNGKDFAMKLGDYINKLQLPDLQVWCSRYIRAKATAEHIKGLLIERQELNEIHAGLCEEMTYAEIENQFPHEFERRALDKYRYRYPGGESYEDVVARLEPLFLDIESANNVLIICHQAVMRCIMAYIQGTDKLDLPYISCPLHTVVKLTFTSTFIQIERIGIGGPAIDTYLPKRQIYR